MRSPRETSPCRRQSAWDSTWTTRPGAKELDGFSERWRPWRGAAAKLLWAYYGALKKGSGIPIVTPAPGGTII